MTRREQINIGCSKWLEKTQVGEIVIVNHFELQKKYGFEAGAEWADANPDGNELLRGASYMHGKLMPLAEAQLERAEKLEAMLKVAVDALRDGDQYSRNHALTKIEEMKKEISGS